MCQKNHLQVDYSVALFFEHQLTQAIEQQAMNVWQGSIWKACL